jgi:hypothetical protein
MRQICVIGLFVMFCIAGYTQTNTHVSNSGLTGSGTLEDFLSQKEIYQDQRITDILLRYAQINKKKNGTDGYRLEIFFSSDTKARARALNVKSEFNLVFPNIASYLLFQTPNFKVRVGDFRNKSEALKIKAFIASKYSNAFIVRDLIQFPRLSNESVEQSQEQ